LRPTSRDLLHPRITLSGIVAHRRNIRSIMLSFRQLAVLGS
jgi:hypothetical protein